MTWFILYASFSLITLLLFYFDKWSAQSGSWRIPEIWLHGFELAGGWPGALLGAQWFRHKRQKWAYMRWLYLSASLHIMFWMWRLLS